MNRLVERFKYGLTEIKRMFQNLLVGYVSVMVNGGIVASTSQQTPALHQSNKQTVADFLSKFLPDFPPRFPLPKT